jgi:quercetin dioxygenase-like cupin family protein
MQVQRNAIEEKRMTTEFKPNVNLMKAFNSQVMLINDIENSENGMTFIKSGSDGPPIHKHPEQEEDVRIVKGQLQVYRKNEWITLNPGDDIHIPKDTAHTYRSRHTEDCVFEYRLTPKRDFSGMMKTFERLMNEQKLKGTSDIKSIIYLALTFKKYGSEVTSVNPPSFVITAMASIGKLLGFKV